MEFFRKLLDEKPQQFSHEISPSKEKHGDRGEEERDLSRLQDCRMQYLFTEKIIMIILRQL